MSHHHDIPRGLDNITRSSTEQGRFGRMFRWLPQETFRDEVLLAIARSMVQNQFLEVDTLGNVGFKQGVEYDKPLGVDDSENENPTIPAGYTYLGQFIDHDITFDPASSLQRQNDPDALHNFRTPGLDLDSVYGRGPEDQPYLYDFGEDHIDDDGAKFLMGDRERDLPRNNNERAIIADPRNDQNRIISQIHALFLRFHNKVVEELRKERPGVAGKVIFLEAQRIVRWHYQWIVLNDYLPKIVGQKTLDDVLGNPSKIGQEPEKYKPNLQFYKPESGLAYIPVEFSAAAFRFGHSMIRPSYALNSEVGGVRKSKNGKASDPPKFEEDDRFFRVPILSDNTKPRANLAGLRFLPEGWDIHFGLFFGEIAEDGAQPSYRIDTSLVDPLALLPSTIVRGSIDPLDNSSVLAFRNLKRGSSFALPSGQSIARAMGREALTDDQLWGTNPAEGKVGGKDRSEVLAMYPELKGRAPLWYYILREAELTQRQEDSENGKALGGHHLGPVGGRIVAEVLVGITYYDHFSYLFLEPAWAPWKEMYRSRISTMAKAKESYEMADLIEWVTKKEDEIKPMP